MPALVLVVTRRAALVSRPGLDPATRGRTACPRCSTRSPRPPTTTASAFARPHRQHDLLQHRARLRDAARPVRADRLRCCAWPARLARKQHVPADGRDVPDRPRRCSSALLVGRDPHRRRAHVLPRPLARARSSKDCHARPDSAVEPSACHTPCRRADLAGSLLLPALLARCRMRSASSTRGTWRNPVMFVVEIGAVLTTLLFASLDPSLFAWADRGLAVADGAVREPRRGGGRGPWQGAGGRAARHARPRHGSPASAPDGTEEPVPAPQLRAGRPRGRGGRQVIPGDGEVVEGVARSTSPPSPASRRP